MQVCKHGSVDQLRHLVLTCGADPRAWFDVPLHGYRGRTAHFSDGEDERAKKETFRMLPQHFAAEAGNFAGLKFMMAEAARDLKTNAAMDGVLFNKGNMVLHLA